LRAACGNAAESESKVIILISRKIVHGEKGTSRGHGDAPKLVAGFCEAVAGTMARIEAPPA
jgi:hypothetical protein